MLLNYKNYNYCFFNREETVSKKYKLLLLIEKMYREQLKKKIWFENSVGSSSILPPFLGQDNGDECKILSEIFMIDSSGAPLYNMILF